MNYIISLKEPITKQKYLKSQNIETYWIKGIDGRNLNKMEISKHFTELYTDYGPRGSIGCAMSHLKTWKTFLETKDDYCIIFEDDVVVKNNFVNRLKDIKKYIPKDYDILYLGSFGGIKKNTFFSIIFDILQMTNNNYTRINKYISKPKVCLGNHAYMLSKKGAKKLIKLLDGKIHNHLDFCIQDLKSRNLINVYTVKTRLAYQTSTNNSISLNVKNTHPLLLNKMFSEIYLDKMVKASYISSVSILQLGHLHITPMTLLFFIFGGILKILKLSIQEIIQIYIILSINDIINKNFVYFIFHLFFLLAIPLIS